MALLICLIFCIFTHLHLANCKIDTNSNHNTNGIMQTWSYEDHPKNVTIQNGIIGQDYTVIYLKIRPFVSLLFALELMFTFC